MIQAHQQTTTIDSWPYYEFEDFIKYLNERSEEEKKAREEEEKKQSKGQNSNNQYNNMMKNASNYKMPNFNMPR
jgi:hypothetical protein